MAYWLSVFTSILLVGCTKSAPPRKTADSAPSGAPSAVSASPVAVAKTAAGFHWSGTVASGKQVWLRNLNGSVTVKAAAGSKIDVSATIRRRGGKASHVQIKVVPHNGTFTICAMWPAKQQSCGPQGQYSLSHVSEQGTQVDLVVKLPRGVATDVSIINGMIRARHLAAAVKARSVNGGVELAAAGPADVASVNGRINVTVERGPVKAKTVNGSIHVHVPKGFGARLVAETVNGSINIGVPHTSSSSSRFRTLATLGKGGVELGLKTVNGSVRVSN